MRLIHHFRPLLELGSCKEYGMAQKTTENGTRRTRKAAPIQPPTVLEPRRDAVPVNNLEEQIRLRAYELYLERGGTPGHESEDWLIAEREVRSRQMHRQAS
jgi:Protein of unknown function (DUF2934)